MSNKCMITPKSAEELNQIASNDNIVLFLNRTDCPHCHNMKPLVEKGCKESGNDLKFIDCPVDKSDICKKIAGALEIEGVPVTVAVPKGESVHNYAWKVVGANKEEFVKKLVATLNTIRGQKGGGSNIPNAQQRIPDAQRQVGRPVPIRNNIDDVILSKISSNKWARFDVPKTIDFCLPGRDSNCDQNKFEQQVIDFYNNW